MITTVFGLPGSGKSTYLAYLAKKALKQSCYDRVYCNYPILGLAVYPISSLEDVVKYDIKNALVLFDEGSLQYDNRDFKTFPRDAVKAIALHRHFADDRSKRFDIVICTQQWDALDKKIRALSGQLIYCSKVGFLTMFRPISRCISISEDSSEIVSGYSLSGIFSAFFICRPIYYKYFDSFTSPERAPVPSQFLQSYDVFCKDPEQERVQDPEQERVQDPDQERDTKSSFCIFTKSQKMVSSFLRIKLLSYRLISKFKGILAVFRKAV